MAERLFTPEQVARLTGTPAPTVNEWIRDERLQSLRLPDGPVRISERQLLGFLEQEGIDIEELMARSVLAGKGVTMQDTSPAARVRRSEDPDGNGSGAEEQPPRPDRPVLALAAPEDATPAVPQPVPFEGTPEEAYEAALRGSNFRGPDASTPLGQAPPQDGAAAPTPDPEPTQTVGATEEDNTEEPSAPATETSPIPETVAPSDGRAPEMAEPSPDSAPTSPPEPEPEPDTPEPRELRPEAEADAEEPAPEAHTDSAEEEHSEPEPDPVPPAPRKRKTARKSARTRSGKKSRSRRKQASKEKPAPDTPADPAGQVAEALVADAVARGASAVHLASDGDGLSLRMRCHGHLQERAAFRRHLPAGLGPRLMAHLKMRAGLDAKAAGPADAAFEISHDSKPVRLELSLLPTLAGESIVLRLDRPASEPVPSAALGLPGEDADRMESLLEQPYGLLLVAAPPRHGIDQVARALAARLADRLQGVILLERQRREALKGAEQCVCHSTTGLDLSRGLQAALRQDPDAIILEDIMDPVSAAACVDAASHGCLVIAGVRADDGPSAVSLLRRMGVGPWPLGSALLGLVARRTLRAPCPDCRREVKPTGRMLEPIGLEPSGADFTLYAREGCAKCGQTGYAGTVTLTSLIPVEDGGAVDAAIREGASVERIARAAREDGARDLVDAAIEALRDGRTTLEEIAAQRIARM